MMRYQKDIHFGFIARTIKDSKVIHKSLNFLTRYDLIDGLDFAEVLICNKVVLQFQHKMEQNNFKCIDEIVQPKITVAIISCHCSFQIVFQGLVPTCIYKVLHIQLIHVRYMMNTFYIRKITRVYPSEYMQIDFF